MQSSTPGDGETVHGFVSWLNASPVVVLLFTVVAAVSATGMFCTAVTTDHWEQLQWDHQILRAILGPRSSLTVHDKVIRLEVPGVGMKNYFSFNFSETNDLFCALVHRQLVTSQSHNIPCSNDWRHLEPLH